MKKVIFVGGTSYSGSTFFDMMLANDANGFSCGEINALFYPYRRKHLDVASLSDKIDWAAIKKDGPDNLYQNLFDKFNNVEFIVDSSKSPLWISERTSELEKAGVEVKNILIWKYPEEFHKSRKKRNREKGWIREWLNYHKYYMSAVKEWRSVKYSELASDSNTLRRVCEALGIDYFEGKEKYWEKDHYTLYGNASAKIHLYDEKSNEYSEYNNEIKGTVNISQVKKSADNAKQHRTIYFDKTTNDFNEKYLNDARFKQILKVLNYADVNNYDIDRQDLKLLSKDLNVSLPYKIYQEIKQKYTPTRIMDLFNKT